ncbi:hypothetical protein [Candidatus Cardinium hertigii]|nr:hypothetical protein [Candidatus Cardinium hertigii]
MKKQFILLRLFLLGSSFTACQISNQTNNRSYRQDKKDKNTASK